MTLNSTPIEHVAEDVDMTLDEMAAAWLDAEEQITRLRRVKAAIEPRLFDILREREATEIVTDAGVIKLEQQFGAYEWDIDALRNMAAGILTTEEWDKAVTVEHVPEQYVARVNTTRMKAALSKKGKPGKDVLARAMRREEKPGRVKVERIDG